MTILAYLPTRKHKNINIDWLYGGDIIRELQKRNPKWNFKIVGGKEKNIYQGVDIYIRPTRHDGLPIMNLECQALKIPYIWSYKSGKYVEPTVEYFESEIKRIIK